MTIETSKYRVTYIRSTGDVPIPGGVTTVHLAQECDVLGTDQVSAIAAAAQAFGCVARDGDWKVQTLRTPCGVPEFKSSTANESALIGTARRL